MKNIIDILTERGLVDNVTSPGLTDVANAPMVVYAGFDPTSDSLQVGNLVAIMALAHFQRCGHRVIAVAGGATGMIGDPSGKDSERALLSPETITQNLIGIRENLSRLLNFEDSKAPAKILNNHDWLNAFSFVDFLRDVGRHFRMGTMLGKESVRARLNSEAGMSFTEFSYQLLQAYDFLRLFDDEGCSLQIGGADQWGNITAGIDLIHKLRGVEAFGLTIPLVCDSTGAKFGKSAGNAVYLSSKKTSCYDFYQFFVRTLDADVVRFLKIFTFLSMEEIHGMEEQVLKEPEKRVAQKKLAEEVTRAVHDQDGLDSALRASAVLFGESMKGLRAAELRGVFADSPSGPLPEGAVGMSVTDLAASAGLCASKGEVRRLVESGGLYVNNQRVERLDVRITDADIIDGEILVLRSGKKKFLLLKKS